MMLEIIVEIPLTFSFSSKLGDVMRTFIVSTKEYRISICVVISETQIGFVLSNPTLSCNSRCIRLKRNSRENRNSHPKRYRNAEGGKPCTTVRDAARQNRR